MKRVDRRQQLKRERRRSRTVIASALCVIAGLYLFVTGADIGNVLLSLLGIAVMATAGVLSFPYLRRQRLQSDSDKKPWKRRIRSVLFTGVFGCALATIWLLIYGVENQNFDATRLGVLVLWLGVALWVPTLFIPRSKFHYPSSFHPEAVRVGISNLTDARSLGLEWPDDKAGLWIGVYQWNHVPELDTRLVLANLPKDHTVFLAIWTEQNATELIELKDLLRASGDRYIEEYDRRGFQKWQTLLALTRSENVVTHIFKFFQNYFESAGHYAFIIAGGELSTWADSLRRLLRMGLNGVTRDMIENSYCVMLTEWDHGMELVTNKVSAEYILKVASELANEWSLPLIKLGEAADS